MTELNNYQEYIATSRYARWLDYKGRRETWDETCWRYVYFWLNKDLIDEDEAQAMYAAIKGLESMPSMRALMTAGVALDRDHMAGYNCAYVAVDDIRAFDEIVYVLMCGTGVGFSVERQSVNKLPTVSEQFFNTDTTIVVHDSKIGWAKSFRELISLLYSGQIPKWDMSQCREKGTPLKTFGGRASGPEPLESLFKFTIEIFKAAAGRKLTSLDVHDIVCKTAEIVVVGGVRRSALISLSNLSDDRMRGAKTGNWYDEDKQPWRGLANNSAVYTEKPDIGVFMKEWTALYESRSGERGVFSRQASDTQVAKNGRRETGHEWGTNPCSEIILRSAQTCNLSEVVVRPNDTFEDLKQKVVMAAIMGTLQSTLTDFRYVRDIWKVNCEEERLLGVSMTGIMDHVVLSGKGYQGAQGFDDYMLCEPEETGWYDLPRILRDLRDVAVETNKEWAERLGIAQSAAVTAVKPSGTVSQLVDSASGIHSRYAPFYIRRVRGDMKDPMTRTMIDQGVPWEPGITNPDVAVFSFPAKSPSGAQVTSDDTAIQQLELYELYQDNWCEHKPSITVYYSDDEFMAAGAWLYARLESCSGVSFLPRDNHVYEQAPYEEIDEETYNQLVLEMPKIDFTRLADYESSDQTVGSQTLACVSGSCEL